MAIRQAHPVAADMQQLAAEYIFAVEGFLVE
jgi:hypothetical protein